MTAAAEIITQAQAAASTMQSAATAAINTALQRLTPPAITGAGTIPFNLITSTFAPSGVPVYTGANFVAPPAPGAAPTMLTVPPVATFTAGALPTAITYMDPTKPLDLAPFTVAPPSITPPVIPPLPGGLASLPPFSPPIFADIALPTKPAITPPTFDATLPDTMLSPLVGTDIDNMFASKWSSTETTYKTDYNASITDIFSKLAANYASYMPLLNDEVNFDVAKNPAVQTGAALMLLSQAARSAETRRASAGVWTQAAKRGFTIPGGAQYSALARLQQAAAEANIKAVTDGAIRDADKKFEYLKFFTERATSVRDKLVAIGTKFTDTLLDIKERARTYANNVVATHIEAYKQSLLLIDKNLELYKSQTIVFETRLRSTLAVLEVYKSELAGVEAATNVDKVKVEAYTAQIGAYSALANAYRASIEGVAASIQIQKLQVDIYGAQVESYRAQVGAKSEEWQGYVAQVQGEVAKQQAYGEQVKAYGATSQAQAVNVEASAEQVKSVMATNEAAARIYAESINAYSALVDGRSEAVKAEIASFEASIHAYTAEMASGEAAARANIAAETANAANMLGLYEANGKIAVAAVESLNDYNIKAADVALGGAHVYATMAGSALAGLVGMGVEVDQTNH